MPDLLLRLVLTPPALMVANLLLETTAITPRIARLRGIKMLGPILMVLLAIPVMTRV